MEFDLFNLYIPEEDLGPRSNIYCRGKKLIEKINGLLDEMISNGDKIYCISKKIAKTLKLHPDTVLKMFRQRNKDISIAVILNLIEEWKMTCNKQSLNVLKVKKEIIHEIEWLISGTSSRTNIKAVKNLNINLAKIIGAHHADGHLCKELTKKGASYKIIIIDHYKSNLVAFRNWFASVFGINLKIRKANSDAWLISFRNKVIGRYFEKIFKFPTGNKTSHNLPSLIKLSNNTIKKAYLLGFMSFDGSVELDKTISLGIMNQTLRDEICSLFSKNLNIKKRKNIEGYYIRSFDTNNKQLRIWKKYFEPKTDKWMKIEFFLGRYSNRDIFLDQNKKEKFDAIINELKNCPTDKFELANKLNMGISTLHSYLQILVLSREIKKTNNPSLIPNIKYDREDAKLSLKYLFHNELFNKLENKISDKTELISILNISEGTYNNWKSRRTSLSFKRIKQIESLLGIKLLAKDIEKFNKKVMEVAH
jgi:hypothetical protein